MPRFLFKWNPDEAKQWKGNKAFTLKQWAYDLLELDSEANVLMHDMNLLLKEVHSQKEFIKVIKQSERCSKTPPVKINPFLD